MLLEVDNLTVRYGEALPAVDRVSFQLQAGEALVVANPPLGDR